MAIHSLLCLIFAASGAAYIYDPNDFAVEVVEYVPGTGIVKDEITGELFDDPNTALGRPTVDTCVEAEPNKPLPVAPVFAAWRTTEVVCIGHRGSLTLKFGRPVFDDINNPFGKDLIVFGNSFQPIGGTSDYYLQDPREVEIGNSFMLKEYGVISVSQDGIHWYTYTMDPFYRNPNPTKFSDPNFPGQYGFLGDFFADSFAPTLGRVYDPCLPAWWGEPTDPTLPLDPAVLEQDLRNTTLAEICLLYGKSAGGTALDISMFDLPVDPQTGRKWIQYIRFDNPRDFGVTPEIDAVADVACIDGDVNRDGQVNLLDLMKLSEHWLE